MVSYMNKQIYTNPILFADYSDPDVIRVQDTYYMVASSFNYTPGLPILISNDLVNWKLVNYAVNNIYGSINYDIPAHSKGVWAPAIRYRQGMFYIYYGMPDDGIYVVKATDPLGTWSDPILVLKGKGLIDPCPFWEEDGRAYIVHGYAKSRIGFKSHLGIFEMREDGEKATSSDQILYCGVETQHTIEGPKVYYRNGFYYIFAPAGGVKTGWQTVLRSKNINGPFEEKIVMMQGSTSINGPHQGGLVDTFKGTEWFVHFQDMGAYGRIVHLQPVVWKEDWPVIGKPTMEEFGEPCLTYESPLPFHNSEHTGLEASDDFSNDTLNLMWQWTGNHYAHFYSLKERPGALRLYSLNTAKAEHPVLWTAANILTQKMIYPSFRMKVSMDISGIAESEKAGITIFGGQYAYYAIVKKEQKYYLSYGLSCGSGDSRLEQEQLTPITSKFFDPEQVVFEVQIVEKDARPEAYFSCSFDGERAYETPWKFVPVDDTWVAAKPGIFAISKEAKGNGYVDIKQVQVTEGILRPMFAAAKNGDFQSVKHFVEYSTESMNTKDEQGRGILHYACLSENMEIIRYLVEQVGMDILEGDAHGTSPLELAGKLELEEVLVYFIEQLGYDSTQTTYDDFYKNPIRTGMYPDPSIVRVGDDYYMVNSTFVYFPCIPISHSKDLIHWEVIGHAITNPEWANIAELECGRGYWAPDISYHNGRFYIAATYRMNDSQNPCRKQMVVSAELPEGPYSQPSYIDEDGIDPSLFWASDGTCHMLLNRGARIMQLSDDATEKIGDARLLYYGDHKRAPEGPHLLEKDGYYYLFLAEGGTGELHRITVSRSTNLYGPYERCPYNPIMNQPDAKAYIQRSGHGKPVQTADGSWWMVYLCGRYIDEKYTVLGRETALDPITWTSDGWPIVNQLNGPSVIQRKPITAKMNPEFKGYLGEHPLFQKWMTVREPEVDAFLMEEQWITIKGSKVEFDQITSRNLLLQRRTDFSFEMKTRMEVPELDESQRAGVICYYDENSWCTFSLVFQKNRYALELREHMGVDALVRILSPEEIEGIQAGQEITLKVRAVDMRYTFFIEKNEIEVPVFSIAKAEYLSDEGLKMGKRFTGTSIGIFAFAGEKEKKVRFQLL